ncbi:MAG: hypothetical protein LBM63_03035 [Rikenellaceae bacterium]|jgi:hypothetical protein|nr:hypothetical protein [Rikenellaceae bacterium]
MKRSELTEIFRETATAVGYAFHTGATHKAGGEVRAYPAVWLEPPVMKSCDGRNEGTVTYRATLHLVTLATMVGAESLREGLETDAMTLKRAVEQDARVSEVTAVACAPATQTLTAHGDVSMTLTCDVKMWYYL